MVGKTSYLQFGGKEDYAQKYNLAACGLEALV